MSDAPDRRERLLNLLAALLKERSGLTREEILQNPSMGYGGSTDASRRAFERDKSSLRAMGVPLHDETRESVSRYYVDPKEYYLPDLDLTRDELAALHVAVTAVGLGSGAGEGALMKLGGLEGTGGMPVAELPFAESLAPLFDASRRRAVVEFRYRDKVRSLEPWGLTSKSGHWYVVGFDRGADDMRVFRADRIAGDITAGEPGSFEVPADFRPDDYLEDQPWLYGGGRPTMVRLRVDVGHEQDLLARAGSDVVAARLPDGSVELELAVTSPATLRSYVLGFLEHAEVIAPDEFRADVVAWLESIAGGAVSPRPDAETQLERVLAMIPWLATHRGATKQEVAQRFRISLHQLDKDLALIMMVGVPPYSPGDYIDVQYDDDTVDLTLAAYFDRPLHLSPNEGLALLAAGRTLLAVEGSDPAGPLATALQKLESALGVGSVQVEFRTPEHLEAIRTAAERGERVEIDYWSGGRDEVTTRRIDPGPAFFALGEWYTDAFCHLRQEQRMFRLDRIRGLRPTREHFAPVAGAAPPDVYHPRPDDPRVTLELPEGASWVAESYPAESVEELPDGRQRVTLAVSELAWLERVLLRVGPAARVVDPPGLATTGSSAAERVLERYRAQPGDGS